MDSKPRPIESADTASTDGISKELGPVVFTGDDEKRLRWTFRKVDATMLFILICSNMLHAIGPGNLGMAKVAGLEDDIGLHGSDFNVVVSLMYPTSLLFMLPSNLILRRLGARIWLSLICVIWGIINMCMAFAKNKVQFIVLRLLLGAAESGAAPGVLMLITLWYPREMVTSRIALFYSAFPAGAIIGGPIASGIMKITNPRFRSWEWIFFIEGLTTAGFGLLMFLLLADYPDSSWLFRKHEKALLKRRMEQDQAEGGHRAVNRKRLWIHARDPLLYVQSLMFFCASFAPITILTFTAMIVNQMGYSPSAAQAMQAAPGICGFVGMLTSRYYPKWFGSHYLGCLFVAGWIITGSSILLGTVNNSARIFALCALAFGGFGASGIEAGWIMSNAGGPTRSAFSGALNSGIGGLSALSASYIYRNKDAPRYLFGHGMNLFAGLLWVVLGTVAYAIIRYRNHQKATNPANISHLTEDEQIDLENDHPEFRYVA
ncbi:hypothetical protein IWW55_000266 [Coemansia sp. RSA 2706]|nr:hypothetical protein IWW55_000266 [Coemansia sp. RSA 2706]